MEERKDGKQHIFLIGFMGSGKSTVGELLAERLSLPFIDSDREIEKSEGKSIDEIFSREGEKAFRDMELNFLVELKGLKPSVVSLGGGLPAINGALELMHQFGLVIYLNTSLLTLIQRLKNEKDLRPLLKDLSDAEFHPFVEDLLSQRVHFYKQAKLIMPNERNSPIELVDKLTKELNKLNY
ncbi:shikimate kinase [Fluviicola taffensis]|uniref:Shikimate kinase n=1 Tax=Fluviicola taffensis (strain DSM 16823 / NCIMB 13979 / RW262) TaxID=755732 RepID=F2IKI6_FLUTR|nr:shikimate kinase [Fluviicola taffensis]AEA45112.1 Shikimate kinase [Fluviicola taffensis DSM 16823]